MKMRRNCVRILACVGLCLGFMGTGPVSYTHLDVYKRQAHVTGVTTRQGRVEDGNTISDYDKEEIRRKFSISTSIVPIEWKFWKINLLDTPGYLDFAGEVDEALAAADGAIIAVSYTHLIISPA